MNSGRIIFFCQSASGDNPIVADTIQRIEALAARPEITSISVIELRGKNKPTTGKISFHVLETNKGKIRALVRLYLTMFKICRSNKIASCYLYMTPTMLPLFWILKPIFGFRLIAWFAHPNFSLKTRLSLKFFCDKWVSVDRAQVLNYPHVKIIGQGINTSLFSPMDNEKKYDLITVSRITPVKKLELIFNAIYLLKQKGRRVTLLIAGAPYVESDNTYKEGLLELQKKLNIDDQIVWAGSVDRHDLPQYYSQVRLMVFPIQGGIGKVTVEAFACGIPVIINDSRANEFLGPRLSELFIASDDVKTMVEKIESILDLDKTSYDAVSAECRKLITDHHSLEKFAERLAFEILN